MLARWTGLGPCSVLFMDIVDYSLQSVEQQLKLKDRFKGYVTETIRDVPENDRVILDTGDGVGNMLPGRSGSRNVCGAQTVELFH
jgi:hypothetical protein